jgi:hypothetical protein
MSYNYLPCNKNYTLEILKFQQKCAELLSIYDDLDSTEDEADRIKIGEIKAVRLA